MHDPPVSTMDALVKGTIDGVPVLVGIVATLLVAVAFVALINAALGELPHGATRRSPCSASSPGRSVR